MFPCLSIQFESWVKIQIQIKSRLHCIDVCIRRRLLSIFYLLQETAARDGLMKMKTVYEANPALGDPMSIQVILKIGIFFSLKIDNFLLLFLCLSTRL